MKASGQELSGHCWLLGTQAFPQGREAPLQDASTQSPAAVRATLGLLLKHEGDRTLVESKAAAMVPRARQAH